MNAFMEEGVIIFFTEAIMLKVCMLMEVVGERLENTDGRWRFEGEEMWGRGDANSRIKKPLDNLG